MSTFQPIGKYHYLFSKPSSCQTAAKVIKNHIRLLSSSQRSTKVNQRKFPVAIVGGGPSGLFIANLFQKYGVDFCLFESQHEEDHFTHPQAHFLNTRTMEILKHYTPSIFEKVKRAMPPVEEWNKFHFGPTMTSKNMMATVQHPVHTPFLAGQDVNGVLLVDNKHTRLSQFPNVNSNPKTGQALSDCSVGHLAQNVFNKILYDEAKSNELPSNLIKFGSDVVRAHNNGASWELTTNDGDVYNASVVVAADGARSRWREDKLGIAMAGQPVIQRLINVHFSLTSVPSYEVLSPAMLYTVFSQKVLAMVVRHSPTDYVMQIPYFPPYQTPESDFTHNKVTEMVEAALGNKEVKFRINSIRPWTMGSLVAESYGQNSVYLLGDAAHVFPPAGGFGMNTGLQDALALAWRLKLQVDGVVSDSTQVYTAERQSVAHHNAALSVRNYNRVLGVMKACYLDERNLPLLLKSLEISAQMGMPLSMRRATFQKLYQTALLPLQMLRNSESPSSSLYSKRVTKNLRQLLDSGQGLPLLFPRNEVGFSYTSSPEGQSLEESNHKVSMDWSQDSIAPMPELKVGRLFPHLPCCILDPLKSMSTRDLSSLVATKHKPCPFALLRITEASTSTDEKELVKLTEDIEKLTPGIDVVPVELIVCGESMNDIAKSTRGLTRLQVNQHIWESIFGLQKLERPIFVLVRPDGHVASILSEELESEALFFHHALQSQLFLSKSDAQ